MNERGRNRNTNLEKGHRITSRKLYSDFVGVWEADLCVFVLHSANNTNQTPGRQTQTAVVSDCHYWIINQARGHN